MRIGTRRQFAGNSSDDVSRVSWKSKRERERESERARFVLVSGATVQRSAIYSRAPRANAARVDIHLLIYTDVRSRRANAARFITLFNAAGVR